VIETVHHVTNVGLVLPYYIYHLPEPLFSAALVFALHEETRNSILNVNVLILITMVLKLHLYKKKNVSRMLRISFQRFVVKHVGLSPGQLRNENDHV
jgi:hypothetical protein